MAISAETLHAKERDVQGTRACQRLRASGEVPAVVYGHKEETLVIQVPCEELGDAVRRHARMFELHLGKKKDHVLLKEVQYDALGDEIVHADFVRVAMDEAVTLKVPILLKGAPKVEHAVLEQTLGEVEVECLPANIPESILVPVAGMTLGQSIHVREIALPPGVTIKTDAAIIVATLAAAAEEEVVAPAAPAEGAVAEPEVIGRKAAEEEAAEGEEAAPEPKKESKKEEK